MIKHSALALSGLLLAVWISFSSAAFDVMYEKFEQFNGSEVCSLKSMRVRKFNRTTSVLDGVMDLKQEADNNYEISVKAAYSPKGNNQFNQYPMKIKPTKLCDFVNGDWRDYYPYFESSSNFPKVGECPIEPKEYRITNMVLDSNMFPPYLPNGLWRLSIIVSRPGGDPLLYVESYFKVADAGVF
ncbi:uncharacterized protein LOC5575791 [Aedes aegypti]|uniref:Uncharacterized protein n=1 Tax=Aedes aegypti TaxID=7159 RepID=A0A1S4FV48_AEDAE|nr:uncharacterized protein LOC5575791 [Aedes aegypti]